MPAMSRVQSALCRSAPWRLASGRVELPWSLQGVELRGDVLEVGAGSAAMAAAVLERHANVTMTVTDYDDAMVASAAVTTTPESARCVSPNCAPSRRASRSSRPASRRSSRDRSCGSR